MSEVKVKKGDSVTQGQVLGISGTNKLDKELGNHLHFEFYAEGQIVNPNTYLDKELQASIKVDNMQKRIIKKIILLLNSWKFQAMEVEQKLLEK